MTTAPGSAAPAAEAGRLQRAWAALQQVLDPEVPALSVCDLGIVRDVREDGAMLEVVLTPTYSGCPATEVIERAVLDAMQTREELYERIGYHAFEQQLDALFAVGRQSSETAG